MTVAFPSSELDGPKLVEKFTSPSPETTAFNVGSLRKNPYDYHAET
jgi:hypothetical protein